MSIEKSAFELNYRQLEAATCHRNALVLAGPGTGKTYLLVARVCDQLAQGVPPHLIRCLTFTRRAVGEVKERLTSQIGAEVACRVPVSTFHSLAFSIVEMVVQQQFGRRLNLITDNARRELVEVLVRSGLKQFPKAIEQLSFSQLILRVEQAIGRSEATDSTAFGQLTSLVRTSYEQELDNQKLWDTYQLVPSATRYLQEHSWLALTPGIGAASFIIDETQDTSPEQVELLAALAKASREGLGRDLVLLAVGDDRQQIFSYLHPSPYPYLQAAFGQLAELHLDKQHRFGTTLNRVAACISKRLGNYPPVTPAIPADDPDGVYSPLLASHPQVNKGQLPVAVYEARDQAEEAAFVAEEAERVLKHCPASRIGILVRNHALADPIVTALSRRQLPYSYVRSSQTKISEAKAIVVLTMHASKGLEYPVVFNTGLCQGLLPKGSVPRIEETKLLFVGVTRAKRLLYLTYPMMLSGEGGRARQVGPSNLLSILE